MSDALDLDDQFERRLRAALQRAAAPSRDADPLDPAAVAAAIRARVTAGDPGAGAAGPVAPGWSPVRGTRGLVLLLVGIAAVVVLVAAVVFGGAPAGWWGGWWGAAPAPHPEITLVSPSPSSSSRAS